MKITNWIRFIITLGSGLAIALALTFSLGIGVALGDDQPDGSTINPTQTTSGTWGPGVITATSNVVINPGVVITIAPGTTIRVAGNNGFTVNGELRSDGPATFTAASATPGAWQGITYATGSSGYLNQVTVEYAQHALVLSTTSPITISYSTLRYNRHLTTAANDDAYGAGLVISAGNHLIDHTEIYSNVVKATGSSAEVYGAGVDIRVGASRLLYSRVYNNSATSTQSNGGGGGIVVRVGSPLIQNSEVTTNTLVTQANLANGGGIGIYGVTQAVIRNSLIAANQSVPTGGYGGGGGIGFETNARAALIDGNLIANNLSMGPGHSEGGGIDAWSGNVVTVTNNLFYSNRSRTIGGAMNINANAGTGLNVNVINNTVIGNSSADGGGLYLQSGGRAYNNIVVGNTATNSGGGMYGCSSTICGNNDVWNNTPNNYNGAAPATDIQVNPLFVGAGSLTQWYHLRPDSPVIDAGTNTGLGLPRTDIDGESRPGYATWDMGFDEVIPDTVAPFASLKKASPVLSFLAAGEPLTYTIQVINNQGVTSNGRITDALPLYTTYTGPTICNVGTCGYDSMGKVITWTGNLTSSGKLILNYRVRIDTPLADGTAITNTAIISMAGQIASTNLVTTTLYNPVFAVSKAALGTPTRGAPFDYQITVRNNSASGGATNVVVTDTLPVGANYVSGGTLVGGNTISLTIPSIAPGGAYAQVTFRISTCQTSVVNQYYQVVTSTQKVKSAPGTPVTTNPAQPALAAGFSRSPFVWESAPTEINVGQTVYFTNTSTTNGSPITSWQWNFGDGFTATGITVNHLYATAGAYTATLTVTDGCGITNTKSVAIRVYSPAFAVTKTAAPEPVEPGQTLNYTIVVANTGQGDAAGLTVSDPLPAHTTYVPGSSQVALPVLQSAIYRDELTSVSYTGTNGTVDWRSRPWIEIGETNGPASGDAVVMTDQGDYSIRIQNSGRGVSRTVDLSGYTSAALTFEYRRNSFEATDYVSVEVSSNGGASWAVLGVFTGTATDSTYLPVSYDISNYISSNTAIRFRASSGMDTSDQFYMDNVQIKGTAYQITTNPGGAPPTLVNGVTLNAGQSMTITYSVTVDKPLAAGVIANTASVTTTYLSTPATGGVNSTVANVPPVVTNPGDQTHAEGQTVSLQIIASDSNGDTLTYSASGLPAGLGINPASGLITGTVDYAAASGSPYTVIVTATDGSLSHSQTFVWTITSVNRAPVVTNPGDQTSTEGQTVSLQVVANDPDLDPLAYSASGLPAGLGINPASGLITGTVDYAAASGSPYTVIVTATDGSLSHNQTFVWTITNVNRAPVVTNPGDQTNTEGQTVSLQVVANDHDLDPLAYSASGLPAGLGINPVSGLITGTVDYAAASGSPYTVIVTATDGSLSHNQTFVWTITNVNRAPVAVNDDYGVGEDTTLTVPAPGVLINDTDADGEPLTAIWVSGPSHGTLVLSANGSFTYTPATDYNGPDSFTYKAKDSLVESNVASVTITVHTGNDAPVAVSDSYTTTTNAPLVKAVPGVLGNDTDNDGDSLTAEQVSAPTHGALTLNSNGSFVYTPTASYAGVDSFTYTAYDGANHSNIATVAITINNPVPSITSLYPVSVTAGSPPFTLVVTGTNFVNGSTIHWNGSALTTLVNGTQLQAAISADAVTTAGPISITVVNPAPGGGASNVSHFTISSPAPSPAFHHIYLPLVMRNNAVLAPDLVVASAMVTPNNVQVIIKNQGTAPVPSGDSFWVDLYVNPSPAPTGVNQVWNDGRSFQGMVWGVSGAALPLAPGETLTLTYGDIYYWKDFSNFTGSLPAGTPVYVQVDSADIETTYGAVLESHEIGGGTYNNILGPIYATNATGTAGTMPPVAKDRPPAYPTNLPARP
jgi:uncharacterized repeat protein (TIGR01451 family)